jgi:drug/metabolite transporter superfamily protein YnfA
MCFSTKTSISSWWILAMMSLFLWYRNERFDRALSVFCFTLGIVQLIEYGIASGTDPHQSGRALFITLWLQCLVLAIGVYVFIQSDRDRADESVSIIAGWNMFLFAIIFVVAMVLSITGGWSFTGNMTQDNNIEWHTNNSSILGNFGWLYLMGIFVPLLLLLAHYSWSDISTAILIVYGASAALCMINSNSDSFGDLWCYLTTGFAFLAWFLAVICDSKQSTLK